MVKDIIGMLFLVSFAIVGFTNIVSDEWNLWGLMVKLGGQ